MEDPQATNKAVTSIQKQFRAKRFMDDILLIYADSPNFDSNSFKEAFSKSECYPPPLKLEDAKENTFLETSFQITHDNKIHHWLKNENVPTEPAKKWRYAHFNSHNPFMQKRAVFLACLKKVQQMASDTQILKQSAIQKIEEFRKLQYPRKLVWTLCTTMGVQTRQSAWFEIRDNMPENQWNT